MNNKGMTTIELLVCFVLISIVSLSLFNTISSFSNKREIESIKSDLLTYKNNVALTIEDDLIHKGLIMVKITKNESDYTVNLTYRDGTVKNLIIYSNDSTQKYYIAYGIDGKMIKYELPDVGSDTDGTKDLRFTDIDVTGEDNCLYIHVGFYHPDLGNKYSINIVAPINYIT